MTTLFNHFLLLADFLSLPSTLSLLVRCYRCSFYDDTFSYANAREFFSLKKNLHLSLHTYSMYVCRERILLNHCSNILRTFSHSHLKYLWILLQDCLSKDNCRTNRFNQTTENLNLKLRRDKSTVCEAQAPFNHSQQRFKSDRCFCTQITAFS